MALHKVKKEQLFEFEATIPMTQVSQHFENKICRYSIIEKMISTLYGSITKV